MNKKNRLLITSVVVATSIALAGCHVFTRNPYTCNLQVSNTVKGVATGAALAGATALAVGANSSTAWGVAGGGAVVGGITGYIMDKHEAKLRERMNCAGVWVCENVNDASNDITLVMPSVQRFTPGSAAICPKFQQVLDAVALEMKEFKYSVAEIPVYTDGVGCDLGMRRAQAIANYLACQGIASHRLVVSTCNTPCNCSPVILHQPCIRSNRPILNPSPVCAHTGKLGPASCCEGK